MVGDALNAVAMTCSVTEYDWRHATNSYGSKTSFGKCANVKTYLWIAGPMKTNEPMK